MPQLERFFELSLDLFCIAREDGYFERINSAFELTLGHSADELLSKPFMHWVHPSDQAGTAAAMEQLLAGHPVTSFENRYRHAEGHWIWLSWKAVVSPDDHLIYAVARDITEQRRLRSLLEAKHTRLETERMAMAKALSAQRQRAEVTLASIGDAVVATDAGTFEIGPRVDYLNPAAEQLLGWRHERARGKPTERVLRLRTEDDEPLDDLVERCLTENQLVSTPVGARLVRWRGEEVDIQGTAAPILGLEGEVLGAVLVLRDATEERKLTLRMEYQATHDPLTGLVNRREFQRRLERALAESREEMKEEGPGVVDQSPEGHVLCYLDLDHFKIVNDTAGHAAGDEMLRQVTEVLRRQTRVADTLARLGGDEFCLLLERCPLSKAKEIAKNLVEKVRNLELRWQGQIFRISVSVGLLPFDGTARDTGLLLVRGDEACYKAKSLGRDRVFIYGSGEGRPGGGG
ncbi:MAG: diguanylate cyclase [Acidobacteriota bacterium]